MLETPNRWSSFTTSADSSVDFIVRPWVKTDDYWDVYWHVTREVKMRFDAEGISHPVPAAGCPCDSGGAGGSGVIQAVGTGSGFQTAVFGVAAERQIRE